MFLFSAPKQETVQELAKPIGFNRTLRLLMAVAYSEGYGELIEFAHMNIQIVDNEDEDE